MKYLSLSFVASSLFIANSVFAAPITSQGVSIEARGQVEPTCLITSSNHSGSVLYKEGETPNSKISFGFQTNMQDIPQVTLSAVSVTGLKKVDGSAATYGTDVQFLMTDDSTDSALQIDIPTDVYQTGTNGNYSLELYAAKMHSDAFFQSTASDGASIQGTLTVTCGDNSVAP
ncbi:hypothetical protein ACPV5G_17025 [Photobacterium damselae]|uniref:hypothetical protein n=1 Tax=Photobacterium damselae TaxID=38293 RepID=UPI004068C7D5